MNKLNNSNKDYIIVKIIKSSLNMLRCKTVASIDKEGHKYNMYVGLSDPYLYVKLGEYYKVPVNRIKKENNYFKYESAQLMKVKNNKLVVA